MQNISSSIDSRHGVSSVWQSVSDAPSDGEFFDALVSAAQGHPVHNHVLFDSFIDERGYGRGPVLSDVTHLLEIAFHEWNTSSFRILSLWQAHAASSVSLPELLDVTPFRRLTIAVGPPTILAGLVIAEHQAHTHRQQLLTLCLSERKGCGVGAILALEALWQPLIEALRFASGRFLVENSASRFRLPNPYPDGLEGLRTFLTAQPLTVAFRRALVFGAQQALEMRNQFFDQLLMRIATFPPAPQRDIAGRLSPL